MTLTEMIQQVVHQMRADRCRGLHITHAKIEKAVLTCWAEVALIEKDRVPRSLVDAGVAGVKRELETT